MQVLLVVRDAADRRIVETVLARRGWATIAIDDERFVLDAVRDLDPRMIVADEAILREGVTGQLLLSAAFRSRSYVIGVTPAVDPDAIQRLVEGGVDDVLLSPVSEAAGVARTSLADARIQRRIRSGGSRSTGYRSGGETPGIVDVQRAFLEAIFENSPEGVVILDENNRVVRINLEFTRVFGYTPDEVIGRSLNDLIVPEDLRTEGKALDVGVHRGERVMVETVRKHKDGHLIEVSVLATPLDVSNPAGAFGIYRDITDEKCREAALRESEARYRALFDQSPVGVFLCDHTLRITHCNGYLSTVLGAPYEEIVGSDLLSLRSSRLLPGLRAALRGEPAFYEGAYRGQSGKYLYVSVQYAPLRDERGLVIGGIGVLEDVSRRVRAEKQAAAHSAELERINGALRDRTRELEAAMNARNRLYSTMNHELRTPISSILLYQELLLAGNLGPLGDEQIRALEHSHTATRHLLDLVRDILDLSKIEAGKVTVQPVEVSLATLLSDLHASLAPFTESHGSVLHLEIADGVGTTLTDPQRLRQIVMNFVSNAAKYGRRNPIHLRCVRRPNEDLVIEVEDRGVGIGEEDLGIVFEDFVQLGSAAADGTGLGLAISRRLANLLGASLEVESVLGSGSVFRVVLPALAAHPNEAQ